MNMCLCDNLPRVLSANQTLSVCHISVAKSAFNQITLLPVWMTMGCRYTMDREEVEVEAFLPGRLPWQVNLALLPCPLCFSSSPATNQKKHLAVN